jgi:hypothetical protein
MEIQIRHASSPSAAPVRESRTLIGMLLLFVAPQLVRGQEARASDAQQSPQRYVQRFLDWYVPVARKSNRGPAWALALKHDSSDFSPDIARALEADFRAQAKVKDEVVGLDGDPFLDSQDLCERYEAGGVVRSGSIVRVDVRGVCAGKRSAQPDVVAELVERNGAWVFVNFLYPDEHTDLLAVLRKLAEDRHPASPVIGVLANGECNDTAVVAVRALFANSGAGWVALTSRAGFERAVPSEISWTIGFDGGSLGTVRTADPRLDARFGWTDVRDRRLALIPGKRPPRRLNSAHAFEGWCSAPVARPLVAVTSGTVRDPEGWKPFHPAPDLIERLLPAFTGIVKGVTVCRAGTEMRIPFRYTARDLRVAGAYQSQTGRRIVGVALDSKANTCNGVRDVEWQNHWFALDGPPRLLGTSLTLVDAGDYDGDGHSELLFWHTGYNEDGYTLLSDSLRKRADLGWHYH